MIVLKNMFKRLLENKMTVVADYCEVKLMKDKKGREGDDSYWQRIDHSTPPFIYGDNESATLLGTVKGIESTREFSCPICLVSYHGYSIFKCEKCDQPFCERCKWSVYTCGRCGYDLTGSACRDYHRERVIRSESRTFVENPCEAFVKPFVPSF